MGEVYRARDNRLERDVAIKVLAPRVTADPDALSRFEREAKAVAALTHPNILSIHDIGLDRGVAFAVTELLEGEPLRSRLDRGPVPWREAVEIAIGVSDGLAATHAKGIIHRDLKPANIFLTTGGHPKILDFGIARVQPAAGALGDTTTLAAAALTHAGVILGTVGYMSPEQAKALSVGAASDIFALGCVLYEMLTGRRAFAEPTAIETLSAIIREEPADMATARVDVPAELDAIVRRCLAKDPDARFPSARDLGDALRDLRQTGRLVAAPVRRPGVKRRGKSIAVLPFVNASADAGVEYLSDGITESIINSLAQVSALRVIARSTAFRYKGRDADPARVGRELDVELILTGRLMQVADSVVIRVELADVTKGWQLWGQQYNRKFADLFLVQEEIATEISDALRVRLSGAEKKRLAKRYTENPAAYRLYLEGRYHWHKRTAAGLQKGIECFEHAIGADPSYALAYAGLADSYNLLGYYGFMRPKDAWAKAGSAAHAGLELDPRLPEVHTSLGALASAYAWDWEEAGRHHARALALKANNSTAYFWYGMYLIRLGKFDEAFKMMDRALEIDPLSLPINAYTGWLMYCARQYDRAAAHLQQTLQLDPSFALTHVHLACVQEQRSETDAAIRSFRTALDLSPDDVLALKGLGHVYGATGQADAAAQIVDRLVALSRERAVAEDSIAIVYAGMGDNDRAFEWLDRACEERSPWLIWLHVDPRFDRLRTDPRFAALLTRVGLSPLDAR
jgi:serine/threonine-protein kinase